MTSDDAYLPHDAIQSHEIRLFIFALVVINDGDTTVDGVAFNDQRRRVLRFIRPFFAVPLHDVLRFGNNAFGSHADPETLAQSALLTLASHVHVDVAIVAVFAGVHRVFRNRSSEEALTPASMRNSS